MNRSRCSSIRPFWHTFVSVSDLSEQQVCAIADSTVRAVVALRNLLNKTSKTLARFCLTVPAAFCAVKPTRRPSVFGDVARRPEAKRQLERGRARRRSAISCCICCFAWHQREQHPKFTVMRRAQTALLRSLLRRNLQADGASGLAACAPAASGLHHALHPTQQPAEHARQVFCMFTSVCRPCTSLHPCAAPNAAHCPAAGNSAVRCSSRTGRRG